MSDIEITTDEAAPALFFSPSTLAFYDHAIWPHALPADSVEVTYELHQELLTQLSSGRVLSSEGGLPVTIEAPPPSAEAIAARIRAERDAKIDALQWIIQRHQSEIALGLTPTLNEPDYLALQAYVQQLRDVPTQPGFPMSIEWPEPPLFIG